MTITDEVIRAATGNWGSGSSVMTVLLGRQRDDVKIAEEIVGKQ